MLHSCSVKFSSDWRIEETISVNEVVHKLSWIGVFGQKTDVAAAGLDHFIL
jgi:hypothetical protein